MDLEDDLREYREIEASAFRRVVESSKLFQGQRKNLVYVYAEEDRFLLGKGSFGSVYTCYLQGESVVRMALKMVKIPSKIEEACKIQQILSTTRQEVRALIKLPHNRNIIKIEDVIGDRSTVYIILEYCNDKDLGTYFKRLRKNNKINSESDVIPYFQQILNGFKQLHRNNIIHRDVKPGNILVHKGVLKIADFGLSKQIFEEREQFFEDHVGTMVTASPQINFKQPYTNKCDIYSLGATLYWMIYNQYPFKSCFTQKEIMSGDNLFGVESAFKVSTQMIKLLKSMLAYHEKKRIDWTHLFNHHLLINNLNNQINDSVYETSKNLRLQLGLTFAIDHEISEKIYNYIFDNNEGDDPANIILSLDQISSNGGIINEEKNSFKRIFTEFTHCKFKLFVFKELLSQLCNFEIPQKSTTKIEAHTVRDLIRLGLQKLILTILVNLYKQLTLRKQPKFFAIYDINKVSELNSFKKLLEALRNECKREQLQSMKPKLSLDEQQNLKKRCQQYQIMTKFPTIFSKQIQKDEFFLFQEMNTAIMQMIFFCKPEIKHLASRLKNLPQIQFIRYRKVVILVHHLFMFLMQNQVFPLKYDANFNYDTANYSAQQKYSDKSNFYVLSKNIINIIDRLQN